MGFGTIAEVVEKTVTAIEAPPMDSLDTVLAVDAASRARAQTVIAGLAT